MYCHNEKHLLKIGHNSDIRHFVFFLSPCFSFYVSNSNVSKGRKKNNSLSLKEACSHQAVSKTWMDRFMLGGAIGLQCEARCELCPCAVSPTDVALETNRSV